MKPKAIVLFSGGLDSRLAVKLMQDQGLEVEAVFFKLPFGGGCCNNFECVLNYSQMQEVSLKVIDCTKSPYLEKYLEIIKNPKTGLGLLSVSGGVGLFDFSVSEDAGLVSWLEFLESGFCSWTKEFSSRLFFVSELFAGVWEFSFSELLKSSSLALSQASNSSWRDNSSLFFK